MTFIPISICLRHLFAPTLLYLMMTATLYKIAEKYRLKPYSTNEVCKVWIVSAISSVNCQVLHCCLPTSLYSLWSFGKPCKNRRYSTVSGLSCDRQSSRVKEMLVTGVDRIPLTHMLNFGHICPLSTPIAEHIRSTVSRADVAVEFILAH